MLRVVFVGVPPDRRFDSGRIQARDPLQVLHQRRVRLMHGGALFWQRPAQPLRVIGVVERLGVRVGGRLPGQRALGVSDRPLIPEGDVPEEVLQRPLPDGSGLLQAIVGDVVKRGEQFAPGVLDPLEQRAYVVGRATTISVVRHLFLPCAPRRDPLPVWLATIGIVPLLS